MRGLCTELGYVGVYFPKLYDAGSNKHIRIAVLCSTPARWATLRCSPTPRGQPGLIDCDLTYLSQGCLSAMIMI